MTRQYVALLVSAMGVAWVTACASGPSVGVRRDYRNAAVTRVSVVPFWSNRPDIDDDVLEAAQKTVVRWMGARRVDTLAPGAVRRRLERAGVWQSFEPDGVIRRNLPDRSGTPDRQSLLAVSKAFIDLHERDAFSTPWAFVGQILYHSATTCWTQADDHSPRTTIAVHPGAPAVLPRPCVVTHLQARLVDTRTGETVWFNRHLRESHFGAHPAPDRQLAHVHAATRLLVENKHGLSRLVPSR